MQKIKKKLTNKKSILSFAGAFSKFVKTKKDLSYEEVKEKAMFLWVKTYTNAD